MNPQPPPYGPWVPQSPPPRRSSSLVPIVLVAVLLVGAVGAGGFFWGASTTGPAGAVAAADPVARPPATLDDERTVDPCAFLGVEAVARFGTTQRYPDYGVLASCRIDLTTSAGEQLGVEAYLNSPSYVDEITGDREVLGDLQIRRPPRRTRSATGWSCWPTAPPSSCW